MPQLTLPEADEQLACTPKEELLSLEILQSYNIRDTLHAYQMAKREKPERFFTEQEKRDGSLTEFDEEDWYSLVEYATVYGREDILFTFKNGMEIKA